MPRSQRRARLPCCMHWCPCYPLVRTSRFVNIAQPWNALLLRKSGWKAIGDNVLPNHLRQQIQLQMSESAVFILCVNGAVFSSHTALAMCCLLEMLAYTAWHATACSALCSVPHTEHGPFFLCFNCNRLARRWAGHAVLCAATGSRWTHTSRRARQLWWASRVCLPGYEPFLTLGSKPEPSSPVARWCGR